MLLLCDSVIVDSFLCLVHGWVMSHIWMGHVSCQQISRELTFLKQFQQNVPSRRLCHHRPQEPRLENCCCWMEIDFCGWSRAQSTYYMHICILLGAENLVGVCVDMVCVCVNNHTWDAYHRNTLQHAATHCNTCGISVKQLRYVRCVALARAPERQRHWEGDKSYICSWNRMRGGGKAGSMHNWKNTNKTKKELRTFLFRVEMQLDLFILWDMTSSYVSHTRESWRIHEWVMSRICLSRKVTDWGDGILLWTIGLFWWKIGLFG